MRPGEGRTRSLTTAICTLTAEMSKGLIATDGLNPAALDFIVATIEQTSDIGQLCHITSHGILDKVVRRAPGLSGELV